MCSISLYIIWTFLSSLVPQGLLQVISLTGLMYSIIIATSALSLAQGHENDSGVIALSKQRTDVHMIQFLV